MRHTYLRPRRGNNGTVKRGGVSKAWSSSGDALEIGNECNADPKVMAVAAHTDEVLELLPMLRSPMADLLLASIQRQADILTKQSEAT